MFVKNIELKLTPLLAYTLLYLFIFYLFFSWWFKLWSTASMLTGHLNKTLSWEHLFFKQNYCGFLWIVKRAKVASIKITPVYRLIGIVLWTMCPCFMTLDRYFDFLSKRKRERWYNYTVIQTYLLRCITSCPCLSSRYLWLAF